eukprot:scaffold2858_cov659-Pavlova_lutheri.AAC.100
MGPKRRPLDVVDWAVLLQIDLAIVGSICGYVMQRLFAIVALVRGIHIAHSQDEAGRSGLRGPAELACGRPEEITTADRPGDATAHFGWEL